MATAPAMADVLAIVEAAYVSQARGGATPASAVAATDPVALACAAAAGAISSKFMAVGAPRSMGFVGCGGLAAALLDAHRVVFAAAAPRELRCAGADADHFVAAHGGRPTSVEEACACDIVCVTARDAAPALRRAWIRRGTHVIVLGAGALDEDVRAGARVIVDDPPAVDAPQVCGTLGEIAAGLKDGRELDEVTIYQGAMIPAIIDAVRQRLASPPRAAEA